VSWLERRAHRRAVRHARTRLQRIEVVPAQGLFNARCHENCVEWLRTHPGRGLTVVECLAVDEGSPVLHYIVRDADGLHHDVTLGWRAEHIEYYHIRDLLEDDLRDIHREFNRSLAEWKDMCTLWWERPFVDRVV
jgi:hypothetical protein